VEKIIWLKRCQSGFMSDTEKTGSYSVIRTPITLSRFFLLLILAGFSISGWLRVSQTVINRDWIERMRIGPGTSYFVISGAIWGAIFLAAIIAILIQLKGAGWFTIEIAIFASAWHWIERLTLTKSPLVETGWQFEVLFNAALLVILFFMMKGFPPSIQNE
jgi:hypothetical protein